MSHVSSIFGTTQKTIRSPNKKSDDQHLNDVPMVDSERLAKKRKNEMLNDGKLIVELDEEKHDSEISNLQLSIQMKGLYDLIANTSQKHSNEISSVNADLSQKIQAVSKKMNKMEEKVESLESNVKVVDEKVMDIAKAAQMNKVMINNMLQENISKCMDIDGIDKSVVDNATDLKSLAVQIISSFNITIKADEIERVSKKEIGKDDNNKTVKARTILLVHFKEFEDKLRILRAKRNINDGRNIYFNATLTPTNKYFMMSARKLTKAVGLKVFFKSGKVNVEKADKGIITIASESDLNNLESYVKAIQQNYQAQTAKL
ncbi:hypothetical protein ACKWTF_011324 [Chironomus riparius]